MTLPHSKPIPPAPIYPPLSQSDYLKALQEGRDRRLRELKQTFGFFSYSVYENDATGEIVVMRTGRPTKTVSDVAGLEGYAKELGIHRR